MQVIIEKFNGVKKEQWKTIFDRIFSVCKKNPQFQVNDRIKELDVEIKILEEKLGKNNDIINRAEEFRKDIQYKLSLLDDQNLDLKSKVLEKLGSEL